MYVRPVGVLDTPLANAVAATVATPCAGAVAMLQVSISPASMSDMVSKELIEAVVLLQRFNSWKMPPKNIGG